MSCQRFCEELSESSTSEKKRGDAILWTSGTGKKFLEAAKMECDSWEFRHIVKVKEVIDKWGSRERRQLSCEVKALWILVPENR